MTRKGAFTPAGGLNMGLYSCLSESDSCALCMQLVGERLSGRWNRWKVTAKRRMNTTRKRKTCLASSVSFNCCFSYWYLYSPILLFRVYCWRPFATVTWLYIFDVLLPRPHCDFFVSLSATLRENGWTDLHEIFKEGVEWPWDDLITFWVNSGQRSICLLSPAIAQTTGVNKSVSLARWQQGAGFVVPRTTAC